MSDRYDYRAYLLERIADRSLRVGVIGLGYVGLPLAVEFARAGFTVTGIDVDPEKVAQLNRGESYLPDVPADSVRPLVEAGRLRAVTDVAAVAELDSVSICVPTPLRKSKDPNISYVVDAADGIAAHAHPGLVVVLESTTYPGTTEEIIVPRLLASGLTPGEDVFVAYSPERIDPANPTWNTRNTPKVIGGLSPVALEVVSALYSTAVDRIVPVSRPAAAEMVKLLENTYRAVNIGLVNEIAIICNHLGLDVWEIIEAAATKPFGFMKFTPGPGLGGHCIPIDPLYLSWKMRSLDYEARFIQLADSINSNMPRHVVGLVADALNQDGRPLRGSRILMLGVSYKPNVCDVRESPALEVLRLLHERGAVLAYNDPHVPELPDHTPVLKCTSLDDTSLAWADCVVITTHHSAYDWEHIASHARLVVDTRNALAGVNGKATAKVVRL
ncbi:MAG: nucleotide sugar dehydrogenase [Armatimonadetes bacterium]|nr:nucleotide sugar dehydrogenase [Armatimonadota bacterium]